MRIIRTYSIFLTGILVAFLSTSCIKSYEPEIVANDVSKYVVSGQVNNGDTIQRVNISTSSAVSESKYFPVTGCTVIIMDDKGNSYTGSDKQDGNYEFVIPQSELVPGTSFKIDIVVPGGSHLVSDFDEIHDCPDIDSVYYEVMEVPGSNPEIPGLGLQFYLDLDAENYTSRNYRFEAFETWEYHSAYPIEWYYNGKVRHQVPIDFSKMVCWKTMPIKSFFTLSTNNLAENKYSHFQLHVVDNYSTPRLLYGYSLIVRQYALSDAAFRYWEDTQINSYQEGGLYVKQPLQVKGNLHDVSNPDKQVLGFFSATSVRSKRIFVKDVPDFPIDYYRDCETGTLLKNGLKQISEWMYPAYLYGNNAGYELRMIDRECVDCLTLGGTTEKPAFWPK